MSSYRESRHSERSEESWLNRGTFNCDIAAIDFLDGALACQGYPIGGSFGGHLLRRFGVSFYQDLIAADGESSKDILETALLAENSSFAEENRRWGAALALLAQPGTPAGFGYPEQTNDGVTLIAVDLPVLKDYYQLPTTVPDSLVVRGLFPVLRKNLTESYFEEVTVPAGAALTIVVK